MNETALQPLHIGIVGCSSEGASLCYRLLCSKSASRLGDHHHPEISMHTPSLHLYVDALDAGDLARVGDLMLASARKLASIGAAFLICPDNTIHQAMAEHVLPRSPLPWIHIAEPVADAAVAAGYKRLALTGSRWLVTSNVYPEMLATCGLECVRPRSEEIDVVHAIIMQELTYGVIRPEALARLQAVIARLRDEEGCDAVILGCTELPLILNAGNCPLPPLSSTELLADAALQRSLAADRASTHR